MCGESSRYLAERPAPGQQVDADEGVRRLSTVMAAVGVEPEPVDDSEHPVIPARRCPFREVAEQHREVVCSLHLGLMRGVLAETRAPLVAERLDPFVKPSLCLAHLTLTVTKPRQRGRR